MHFQEARKVEDQMRFHRLNNVLLVVFLHLSKY